MKLFSKWGLVAVFTSLIVVFAAIVLISSSLTSRRTLLGHARNIMENIASYTIDKSGSHLLPARHAAELTLGLSQSNIVNSENTDSMLAYFYEQLSIYPQFSGIYYGNVKGEFIMASRYNELEPGGSFTKIIQYRDGRRIVEKIYLNADRQEIKRVVDADDAYDPRVRPWFIKSVEEKGLIWTDPYVFFTSQKPGITTANPVFSQSEGLMGVIGVDIEIDELSTFLSKLTVSEHGLAFLINHNGDVVAYPDLSKIQQRVNEQKFRLSKIEELDDPVARKAWIALEEHWADGHLKAPVFTSFEQDGQYYHAMFAPFSDSQWPWAIGIYIPENDYLGSLKRTQMFNILMAVLAVMVAGLIGLGVARKLDGARAAAESADEAKSQFLARMSHEIRTPMNAILGAGELLAESKLDSTQKQCVHLLSTAGGHLREVINDVLDLSRVEAGAYEPQNVRFHLTELLDQTCGVFALPAKERGLHFTCRAAPGTPARLIGDAGMLKQVLLNLVGNAMKFTAEGLVEVLAQETTPAPGSGEDSVTLLFTVRDSGIGIPKDKIDMIFETFTQVDGSVSRKYGGTGLGLAICRHLVRLMGGTISVESATDKGSLFSFTAVLKVDTAQEERPEEPEQRQEPATLRPVRLLLVEDDESNRLLLALYLRGTPHIMDTAVNGEEGVAKYKSGTYDLVFMDVEMPILDGYEATRAIRRFERENDLPATPLVALTAHAMEEQREKSIQAGCTGHITKPIHKQAFLRAVNVFAK